MSHAQIQSFNAFILSQYLLLQFQSTTRYWESSDAPFRLKSALTMIHPVRKTSTSTDFAYVSTITDNEKVQL